MIQDTITATRSPQAKAIARYWNRSERWANIIGYGLLVIVAIGVLSTASLHVLAAYMLLVGAPFFVGFGYMVQNIEYGSRTRMLLAQGFTPKDIVAATLRHNTIQVVVGFAIVVVYATILEPRIWTHLVDVVLKHPDAKTFIAVFTDEGLVVEGLTQVFNPGTLWGVPVSVYLVGLVLFGILSSISGSLAGVAQANLYYSTQGMTPLIRVPLVVFAFAIGWVLTITMAIPLGWWALHRTSADYLQDAAIRAK